LAIERFIRSQAEPAVTLIKTTDNLGFGRACNVVARQENFFSLSFPRLDCGMTAALCSRTVFADTWPRRQPDPPSASAPAESLGRAGTCPLCPGLFLTRRPRSIFWSLQTHALSAPESQEVEQIMGADYDDLGGMDEGFFMYFEEVDRCKRLAEAGGEIWFWPEARVQHLAGDSAEAEPVKARMIHVLRESCRKYVGNIAGLPAPDGSNSSIVSRGFKNRRASRCCG